MGIILQGLVGNGPLRHTDDPAPVRAGSHRRQACASRPSRVSSNRATFVTRSRPAAEPPRKSKPGPALSPPRLTRACSAPRLWRDKEMPARLVGHAADWRSLFVKSTCPCSPDSAPHVYDPAVEFSLAGGVSSPLADDHHGQPDIDMPGQRQRRRVAADVGTRIARCSATTSWPPVRPQKVCLRCYA